MARILVANDLHGRSSAAGVAVHLAEGLARRGHEVAFLATTQERDRVVTESRDGVDLRVVLTPRYNLRWRAWRSLDNPAGVEAVARMTEEWKPDIVHFHNLHIHLSYAALGAARARGAKTILHVHDIMPVCHQKMFCHLDERWSPGDPVAYEAGLKCALCVRGRWNPLRNRRIQAVLHRDVDRLVAVSDEMGAALRHNGLGDPVTIPNGLPMDGGDVDDATVEAFRAEHGLVGRKVVFYGGRLDRLKGGLELVRALRRVRREVPEAVLLTVGDALPGFREEMEGLARRLGLADALVHAGWQTGERLAAAYRVADVVTSPSLCFESFGLVNLEAMRAGRPVVSSAWGGPSDVVEDGVTGYLVNPLQVAVMADRLTRLLADPAHARAMGRAGRARAERLFSIDAMLDAAEAVYADLLPGAATGAERDEA